MDSRTFDRLVALWLFGSLLMAIAACLWYLWHNMSIVGWLALGGFLAWLAVTGALVAMTVR